MEQSRVFEVRVNKTLIGRCKIDADYAIAQKLISQALIDKIILNDDLACPKVIHYKVVDETSSMKEIGSTVRSIGRKQAVAVPRPGTKKAKAVVKKKKGKK